MKEICNKDNCTGCTACVAICPKACVSLVKDSEGFNYPIIDEEKCINCGLCQKTCPVITNPTKGDFKRFAYTVKNKDIDIRLKCSSGGAVTAFSEYMLMQGGVVYAAIFDESLQVRHSRIDNISDLYKIPGSKYVQSDLDGVFKNILIDIKTGKKVLFCGTPCQNAGLNNYLGKYRNKVLLVDFVCHGVPSPLLWKKYLELSNTDKHLLTNVNFRSKHFGYHMASMECNYDDGVNTYRSARTNIMLKCYFKNAADRYSCYKCKFKTIERCTDMTVFDSWHASALNSQIIDDDKGYTNVIIQSQIGKKYFEQCSKLLDLYDINLESSIELDGKMAMKSVQMPEYRMGFYESLISIGLEKTVDMFFPIRKKDFFVETIKEFLNKIHLSYYFKKIVNHKLFSGE